MKIVNPLTGVGQDIIILSAPLKIFLKYFPQFNEIAEVMSGPMVKRKYLYARLIHKKYIPGEKTCVNTSPHVDGEDSFYSLVCWGDKRTEFFNGGEIAIPENLKGPLERSRFIESLNLEDRHFLEVAEGEVVQYNSGHIHRGRKFESPGNRTFFRIQSTNQLFATKAEFPLEMYQRALKNS